ncbi:MAG: TIGR04084 family radical SAM/SPASM domain-containing protein [Nitrososphaeria archaeon]
MLYIIYTTGKCNLNCKYCGGSFSKEKMPWEIKYKFDDLKRLLKKDRECYICFYGGEPLLNQIFIKKVIKEIPAKKFVLQTNGLLINDTEFELLNKFDVILLSIDGVKEITDMYRGKGVYDRILENARLLKKKGFKGDLVARMTLTEEGNIYRDVLHLLSTGLFDHIHWQLNVVWSERWKNFEGWVKNNYLPNLEKLLNFWFKKMQEKTILGIAPFQGIFKRNLYGGTMPPCGSGIDSVTVTTDGRILSCPIAVEEKWAVLSEDLKSFRKPEKILIEEPCRSCFVSRECGGRCLYAYMEKFWGETGFKEICKLNIWLIERIRELKPKIIEMAKTGKIQLDNLIYPTYNNSIEIIP